MAFRSVVFPGVLSAGADSAPAFQVDIARSAAGKEKRVSRRGVALHSFTVPLNLRKIDDIHTLKRHFLAVEGPKYSFPFLDRLDSRSGAPDAENAANAITALDCPIGTGDGVTAAFQIYKTYTFGGYTYYRPIYLPISGTLLVAVDNVTKTETTHYTVNYDTGVITFTAGNIPANTKIVRAGFQFRCKVRYATNSLQSVMESYRAGSAQLTLTEVED